MPKRCWGTLWVTPQSKRGSAKASRFPLSVCGSTILVMSDPKNIYAAESAAQAEDLRPTNGSSMFKPIRQLIIFVLGMSVLVVGIAMIVLPGPATIVIPAGLAILATEFVWAQRWLKYLKRRAQEVANWTSGAAVASNERDEHAGETGAGKTGP